MVTAAWTLWVMFIMGVHGQQTYTAHLKCKNQTVCEVLLDRVFESNRIIMTWMTDENGHKVPETIRHYQ